MRNQLFRMLSIVALLWIPLNSFSQGINAIDGMQYESLCNVKCQSNKNFKVFVDKQKRYRVTSKNFNGGALCCDIEYQIDETQDYSIEAVIEQVDTNDRQTYGIAFGAKDFDNISYFLINGIGQYNIFVKTEGIITYETRWRNSNFINSGDNCNKVKIWKHNNKIHFIVNGRVITSLDSYKLAGNLHGFCVAGNGEFAIHNFKIQESAPEDSKVSLIQETASTTTKESQTSSQTKESLQIVGSGTGFLIDKRGYLATNHHVIYDAGAIGICLQIDGEWQSFDGIVVKDDPTNDLAIIKIEDPKFKEFDNLPYAFSFDTEDIASEIFTLGYPQVQVMGTDVKYTTGVINARTGVQGDPTHYQISAHIDHGNSGGPLFNEHGYIIGITDSGLDKAKFGDVNYAIKSMYLKILADALPKNLEFANDRSISEKKRTEQIKTLSQYVALILIAK